MAKQARTDAEWIVIDPTTLGDDTQLAYMTYKDAYKAMKAMREAFEQSMASAVELPAGKRLVFGYNFGKLSVAVVEDERKPVAKAGAQSLSSYLASMQVKGR
jgi:hypothetical protein